VPTVDENVPVSKSILRVEDLELMDQYKITTSLVVPRPIGWIGSVDSGGRRNLAPYSFFNAVSGMPPTFVFSPSAGMRRDTLDNVTATREFTINIVTEEVAGAMNATAASLPAGSDEFAHAGLTVAEATDVAAPLVAEAKANFECRVADIVTIPDSDAHKLVIGIASVIHIADSIFDAGKMYVDQANLDAVGRHAGSVYSRSSDQFEIERPS